jgi:hypothetical protein
MPGVSRLAAIRRARNHSLAGARLRDPAQVPWSGVLVSEAGQDTRVQA